MKITVLTITLFLIGSLSCVAGSTEEAYSKLSAYETSDTEKKDLFGDLNPNQVHVSKFLITKLNASPSPSKDAGTKGAHAVIGDLLILAPVDMFEWILDHRDELTVYGRKNVVNALRSLEHKESFDLLVYFLNDKGVVANKHAAALSPGPYYDIRVCDAAYNSLAKKLQKTSDLPENLPRKLFASSRVEERDTVIQRFSEWWKVVSSNKLRNKTSLGKDRPSIAVKLGLDQEAH